MIIILNNKEIVKDTLKYIENFGVRRNWFARKLNLQDATIYNWLAGRARLSQEKLIMVQEIINRGNSHEC